MQIIDINGVEFIVGLRDQFEKRPDRKDHIRPLQGDLCFMPAAGGYITNGEIYQASGIEMNKVDFATPQDWFNEWNEMIKSRGGAVWSYDCESIMGHPIFKDEAWSKIEALITLRVRPDAFIKPSYSQEVEDEQVS